MSLLLRNQTVEKKVNVTYYTVLQNEHDYFVAKEKINLFINRVTDDVALYILDVFDLCLPYNSILSKFFWQCVNNG